MSKSEPYGFARLSLKEQANIIKSVSTVIATRQTTFHHMELYELDTLFVEITFSKYQAFKSIKEIKYIHDLEDVQLYLDEIKLSTNCA